MHVFFSHPVVVYALSIKSSLDRFGKASLIVWEVVKITSCDRVRRIIKKFLKKVADWSTFAKLHLWGNVLHQHNSAYIKHILTAKIPWYSTAGTRASNNGTLGCVLF